jgi:aminoglycoside phosphotransferase (APT) family kinase protein
MGREARIQRALAGTPVPVPKVVLQEASGELLGVPCYVMEKVPGHVIRAELPDGYARTPAEKLSTLGDPLTGLGLLLFYWREPGEDQPALTPAVTRNPGFPGRAHLVERYVRRTGAQLDDIAFYEAFAHFKFAVIAQGIAARVAAGSMAGQDFGNLDEEVLKIAEEGPQQARGGLRNGLRAIAEGGGSVCADVGVHAGGGIPRGDGV